MDIFCCNLESSFSCVQCQHSYLQTVWMFGVWYTWSVDAAGFFEKVYERLYDKDGITVSRSPLKIYNEVFRPQDRTAQGPRQPTLFLICLYTNVGGKGQRNCEYSGSQASYVWHSRSSSADTGKDILARGPYRILLASGLRNLQDLQAILR